MASNASKECGVCNNEFSAEANCPRLLPCFDCLCSNCIDQLIATNQKCCPFCDKTFTATSAQDFRINTIVLDLLKYVAEMETRTRSPHRGRSVGYSVWQKDFRSDLSKENLADCQKAKAETENAIKNNVELRDEISQSNTRIKEEIFPILKKIETRNGKQIKHLEEENATLHNQLEAIKEKIRGLNATDVKLKSAKNFVAAGPLLDMTEDITKKLEKSLDDWKSFLSRDEIKRHSFVKDMVKTNSMISGIQEVLSQTSYDDDDEEEVNPIPGMVAEDISVDALRRMSEPVRRMVIEGRLFAVQDLQEGRRRYARISITEEDQLLLHHLREEEEVSLPANVHLLKHDEVMSLVDITCRRTFLELGVEGGIRSLGRILIRLLNVQGYHEKPFFFLCTGQMGHSYASSNISQVQNKGNEGESVLMGNYERNDGEGGKAVGVGVDWETKHCREFSVRPSWVKGSVSGYIVGERRPSLFTIKTRDNPRWNDNGIFGKVESGLNVLIEAISQHPNVEIIKIIDCGIVLSRSQNSSLAFTQ